ncbi:MAG TPA: serine/threonine-protein kinase [Ktedonobacteraceae bacterium]
MSTSLFCDFCGAALAETTSLCTACGAAIVSSCSAIAPPGKQIATASGYAQTASSPSQTPCALPPKFLLARRYRILRQLGRGGFATVYQARDRAQGNRLVAIKQFHLETLSLQAMLDATDAYTREVNHLSQLRHRHLPRIYAHFMDEQHWYIVMEYIDGRTLEEVLQNSRHGSLPAMQVLDIGIVLCDVLRYLHTRQPPLIFRDVKPANVILTRSNKLYLIDFGTTKLYRPGWKDTGPLGTPGYAAPEQYGRRAHTTPQSDIYSLGATLQTLLTGKEPLEILQHGLPLKPSRRVPPRLQHEITRMLVREATSRPSNVTEVKQTLQEIKAQFPSQKIKAACSFFAETFKETSALACMALILLAFVDVAAFADMTLQVLWAISLLIIVGFTTLSSIFKLRIASQESQARLATSEKFSIIWRQLSLSLPLSLLASMALYYFMYIINLFGSSPGDENLGVDVVTFVIIVGGSIVASLGWAIRQFFVVRSARKRANQRQQEILIQQLTRIHH